MRTILESSKTPIAVIIEELETTQAAFAREFHLDPSTINRFVSGERNVNVDLAVAINKKYPIYNIDFILGRSEEKIDEAGSIVYALNGIFDKITTTPKTYTDKNGERVKGQFLMFSMSENLYKWLVERDHAAELQEQGMKSYADEISKINKEFIANTDREKTINCVLIPSNNLMEIIESEERNRKVMDEILSLASDSHVYLDEEAE